MYTEFKTIQNFTVDYVTYSIECGCISRIVEVCLELHSSGMNFLLRSISFTLSLGRATPIYITLGRIRSVSYCMPHVQFSSDCRNQAKLKTLERGRRVFRTKERFFVRENRKFDKVETDYRNHEWVCRQFCMNVCLYENESIRSNLNKWHSNHYSQCAFEMNGGIRLEYCSLWCERK